MKHNEGSAVILDWVLNDEEAIDIFEKSADQLEACTPTAVLSELIRNAVTRRVENTGSGLGARLLAVTDWPEVAEGFANSLSFSLSDA